jgi:hypothetical protein
MKKQTGFLDTIMELIPQLDLQELQLLKITVDVMIDKTKKGED